MHRPGILTEILLAACICNAATTALYASSADDDGVLPITVQVPYGYLFLHVPTWSAGAPPLHAWGFDLGTTVTNNFIYSDEVGDALAARTSREPMTRSEFDGIAAAHPGKDLYYFDSELSRLYARIGTTVAPSVVVGAVLSAVRNSGGPGMDGFVEGFHNTLGIGQAHRDVVPRGRITAGLRIGAHEEFFSDDSRSGINDPVVFVEWAPRRRLGGWGMSLTSGAKIPIASTAKRLSTGSADFGVVLAVTGDLGRWCVNFNAGAVWAGRVTFFDDLEPVAAAGVSGSFGYRFRTTSVWLQLQWEQSPLRRATDTPLGDDVRDISIGTRFPLAGAVRGYFAVTENVLRFDNSSDIGFHGGITWLLK